MGIVSGRPWRARVGSGASTALRRGRTGVAAPQQGFDERVAARRAWIGAGIGGAPGREADESLSATRAGS